MRLHEISETPQLWVSRMICWWIVPSVCQWYVGVCSKKHRVRETISCPLVHVIVSPAPPALLFLICCPLYNHLYMNSLSACVHGNFLTLGTLCSFFFSSWFECGFLEWRVRGLWVIERISWLQVLGEARVPVEGKPNKLAIFLYV